jgi:hypothetical protein
MRLNMNYTVEKTNSYLIMNWHDLKAFWIEQMQMTGYSDKDYENDYNNMVHNYGKVFIIFGNGSSWKAERLFNIAA